MPSCHLNFCQWKGASVVHLQADESPHYCIPLACGAPGFDTSCVSAPAFKGTFSNCLLWNATYKVLSLHDRKGCHSSWRLDAWSHLASIAISSRPIASHRRRQWDCRLNYIVTIFENFRILVFKVVWYSNSIQIQIKFIAILLQMKYRINKRPVKITTKWYHVSP